MFQMFNSEPSSSVEMLFPFTKAIMKEVLGATMVVSTVTYVNILSRM